MGSNARPAKRRGLLALLGALTLAITVVLGVTVAVADTTPSVSIAAPSGVTYTSAHLTGTVNPNGGPSTTEWHFEYSETGEEGSYNWGPGGELSGPEAEGNSPVAVEGDLTGLKPGAFYYVRLVATNEFGNNRAVASTFLSTEALASPSVSIDAPSSVTSSGAHFEGEINPEGTDPAFEVAWRFECTPGCPGLEGNLPPGTSPETVEADATNLLPGTAYEVNLIAKNAGEPLSAGPESFTTDAIAPQVEGQSAAPSSSEATLKAQLNPGGAQTTYYFQYGPSAAYGQSTAPKLATGAQAKAVSDSISGLSPAATYHYRLVAENSEGKTEGPDRTFTTYAKGQAGGSCANEAIRQQQTAQALADCRAYEMVSPLDKNNSNVNPVAIGRSSSDGNGFKFEAGGSFGDAASSLLTNQYTSWRTSSGWTTESLNPYITTEPLALAVTNQGYYEFTDDLTKGILLSSHDPNDRSSDVSQDNRALYLRTKGEASFTRLTPRPSFVSPFMSPTYLGASNDMSRIFLESSEQLTPDAPPLFTSEPYEWHAGELRPIGILPNDEIAPEGAKVGRGEEFINGTQAAISGDGSQVVLTMGSPSQLYLRQNGKSELISFSREAGEEGSPAAHGATFMGSASEDGVKLSTVYFISPDPLVGEPAGDPSNGEENQLYAYDVQSGELSLVSVDSEPAQGGALVSPSWMGAAADGSYVYFIAKEPLLPGLDESVYVIYVWHDGVVSVVAEQNTGTTEIGAQNYRVSPDGKRLAYEDILSSSGPVNIFLYDAASGSKRCVSCDAEGKGGPAYFIKNPPTGYRGITKQRYNPNNLSDDGSRVFFETTTALVSRDANGTNDVYEWHEGRVSLISSGRSPVGSHFLEASPDGRDVFFVTREQLAPQDNDQLVDAYDARIGGGFPYEAPPAPCSGDSCQGAPDAGRAWSAPSSTQLAGAGNAHERRKARCVAPRKAKRTTTAAKRAKASKAKPRCTKPRPSNKSKKKKASAKSKGGNR